MVSGKGYSKDETLQSSSETTSGVYGRKPQVQSFGGAAPSAKEFGCAAPQGAQGPRGAAPRDEWESGVLQSSEEIKYLFEW